MPIKFLQIAKSSQVEHIGYDRESHALYVKFHRGGLYAYQGVCSDVADRFLRAESHGKFLAAEIKGRYDYSKVDPDHEAWTAMKASNEVFVQ